MAEKSEQAFRTIGELSDDLGVPQHVLRYWETRFPQLKPMQRAGNRRYYRPADVMLARRIHGLLNAQGYTIRGVQRLLEEKAPPQDTSPVATAAAPASTGLSREHLLAIRAYLADALSDVGG